MTLKTVKYYAKWLIYSSCLHEINVYLLWIYTNFFHAQLSPLLYMEEDVEVIYLKKMSFTAATSTEEALSLDYDTDDAEFHYKFTAFGRCRVYTNELFPHYTQFISLKSSALLLWTDQLNTVSGLLKLCNCLWLCCSRNYLLPLKYNIKQIFLYVQSSMELVQILDLKNSLMFESCSLAALI